jgi:hypothetical protein
MMKQSDKVKIIDFMGFDSRNGNGAGLPPGFLTAVEAMGYNRTVAFDWRL